MSFIRCGLCLRVPWRPETHCCLLPGTGPFIHEKCPQLKKEPHSHRSTLCIQKEINSTYSSGTGKSHRGFGSASVNCMWGEFNLCSFFLFVFLDFHPPSLGKPAQCSAVLCTDIHASWKASTGPERDTAVRKVVPKLRDGVISRNIIALKWFLYFWDWSCNPTVVAVAGIVETCQALGNLCTVLCCIMRWRFKYCKWVLKFRRKTLGHCVSLMVTIHCLK